MKKLILSLLALCATASFAQKIEIEFRDGSSVSYNVTDIRDVYISNTDGGGEEGEDHDYVDLGLPSGTLWATCNVGANSPYEEGDHFA